MLRACLSATGLLALLLIFNHGPQIASAQTTNGGHYNDWTNSNRVRQSSSARPQATVASSTGENFFATPDDKRLFDIEVAKGHDLYARGEISAAREAYERALKINKNNPDAINGRALSAMALRDYSTAISDLNSIENSWDDNPLLFYNRGLAYCTF